MTTSFSSLLALIAVGVLSSCATVPEGKRQDTRFLYEEACSPGKGIEAVQGSVWLKASSQEASGQFPALVLAKTPDQLTLEVTNLLGGTEAIIRVNGTYYNIQAAKKNKGQSREGYGSWGGIPLNWATELFLGKIPCPGRSELKRSELSVNDDGDLVVEVPGDVPGGGERYTYHFKSWAGGLWPQKLKWEKLGTGAPREVSFEFDQPEDATGSPLKWKAESSRGQVKVRWRDRDVTIGKEPKSGV